MAREGASRGRWASGRRRALLVLLAAVLLLAAGAYAGRAYLLTSIGRALIVSEPPRRADAILVLNGSAYRGVGAARLWRAGYAPRVYVVRAEPVPPELQGIQPQQTDMIVAVLRREGVPDSAIRVLEPPRPVTSTREEAAAFAGFARSHGLHRVLLVTSEFHSRRSMWTFHHTPAAQNLDMISTPIRDWAFGAENWWHHEGGLITVAQEILKFGYYLLS